MLPKDYSIAQLETLIISKDDIFKGTFGDFDCTLPQPWLDEFSQFCKANCPHITYALIRLTTVWNYSACKLGVPYSCCPEVRLAIANWENHNSIADDLSSGKLSHADFATMVW